MHSLLSFSIHHHPRFSYRAENSEIILLIGTFALSPSEACIVITAPALLLLQAIRERVSGWEIKGIMSSKLWLTLNEEDDWAEGGQYYANNMPPHPRHASIDMFILCYYWGWRIGLNWRPTMQKRTAKQREPTLCSETTAIKMKLLWIFVIVATATAVLHVVIIIFQ